MRTASRTLADLRPSAAAAAPAAPSLDAPAGLAAAGFATGPNAPFDAVASAVESLGGRSPGLVLAFPPATLEPSAAARQVAAAAPGIPFAGMSSDGILAAGGVIESGCAALVFDDSVAVGVGIGAGASRAPYDAARRATSRAVAGLELRPRHSLVLLFFDPESSNHAQIVAGAYEVTGPRVPLAGGGANAPLSHVARSELAAYADGEASADSVVAAAIVSPEPIGVGMAHGCNLRGIPAIVTRSDGRAIRSLNGRPAEAVYLEAIGHAGRRLDDREFERLGVLHPLAQIELTGSIRPRHVRGRADGGGLLCASTIPPNAAVAFTEQTPASICSSAGMSVAEALDDVARPPRAVLAFAGAARRRVLEGDAESETRTVAAMLPGTSPVAGLYVRGEVARKRGATGDLNHAFVTVAFA
jgi:hypothetical protein